MPTRNINLTEHFDRFVEQQIDCGKYKNASEVLRAGLRLLEEQLQSDQHKLEILRKLAAEGFRAIDQGMGLEISSDTALESAITKIGRRVANTIKTDRAK